MVPWPGFSWVVASVKFKTRLGMKGDRTTKGGSQQEAMSIEKRLGFGPPRRALPI